MIRYLARRAGHGLLMLVGISILLFLLFQAAPGDFLSDARMNSQISAETLAQLRTISPELQKECQRSIRQAAQPLQQAVASRIPARAPLSGMAHKGRTGWGKARVRTKFGGRKRKSAEEWPLVSVQESQCTSTTVSAIAHRLAAACMSQVRAADSLRHRAHPSNNPSRKICSSPNQSYWTWMTAQRADMTTTPGTTARRDGIQPR